MKRKSAALSLELGYLKVGPSHAKLDGRVWDWKSDSWQPQEKRREILCINDAQQGTSHIQLFQLPGKLSVPQFLVSEGPLYRDELTREKATFSIVQVAFQNCNDHLSYEYARLQQN